MESYYSFFHAYRTRYGLSEQQARDGVDFELTVNGQQVIPTWSGDYNVAMFPYLYDEVDIMGTVYKAMKREVFRDYYYQYYLLGSIHKTDKFQNMGVNPESGLLIIRERVDDAYRLVGSPTEWFWEIWPGMTLIDLKAMAPARVQSFMSEHKDVFAGTALAIIGAATIAGFAGVGAGAGAEAGAVAPGVTAVSAPVVSAPVVSAPTVSLASSTAILSGPTTFAPVAASGAVTSGTGILGSIGAGVSALFKDATDAGTNILKSVVGSKIQQEVQSLFGATGETGTGTETVADTSSPLSFMNKVGMLPVLVLIAVLSYILFFRR